MCANNEVLKIVFFFRIYSKTQSVIVDGASEYKKCFDLFGAPHLDEANNISVSDLRKKYENSGKDFEDVENQLKQAATNAGFEEYEFETLNLSDLWVDFDGSLPRRIRCIVHLFALMAKIDFKSRRQIEFWDVNPHGKFKSEFNFKKY